MKNALNQCKTLNCNETKQFFQRITAVFQKKHVICNHTNFKTVCTKKTLLSMQSNTNNETKA